MSAMKTFHKWLKRANLDTKPHQIAAMKWCLEREHSGSIRGGILADEMGLGKTIVMLGLCVSHYQRAGTLIIVPRSILKQWEGAIKKFLGHKPVIYHGSVDVSAIDEAPIVITTYGTACARSLSIRSRKWGRIICDEAHHLRNRGDSYTVVRLIPARYRWMITGTPIQNSRSDIGALFTSLGFGYMTSDAIDGAIESHLLRRTKEQVGIKLPPLNFHNLEIAWEGEDENDAAGEVHDIAHSGGGGEMGESIGPCAFVRYLRAKQMCLFPPLLGNLTNVCESSKLDAVVEQILRRKGNGRSKLVFASFHHEIDTLKKRLRGLTVGVLDGRTKDREHMLGSGTGAREVLMMLPKEIASRVAGFLQYDVLIVQIQTACEGLNLQQFKEVYFTGPHWNPAVEDQAIARCHRIGQKDAVDVFRFAMVSLEDGNVPSLDQYIQEKQLTKRKFML